MNELASQSEPTPAPERWTTRSNESELTTRSAIRDPFDPAGPLPAGACLLEASAGTGKTHTIATLVARYVAEGRVDIRRILVVAFGRAASRELRDRVRERLIDARRTLRDATEDDEGGIRLDPAWQQLVAVDEAERAARLERIDRALAGIDDAPILTTHGFAARMLAQGGLASDVDPRETLCADTGWLVDEVVNDLYLAKYANLRPDFSVASAYRIAEAVVADPQAAIRRADPEDDAAAIARVRFAGAVRSEVATRLRRRLQFTYDDQIARLATALRSSESGERVRARLREQFQVVLVDEFQDTDQLQWQILSDAFLGHRPLVLIGDPKQAIYGFRGGDLQTYLAAASEVEQHLTLGVNWRSDPGVVAGINTLFGAVALGDPSVTVPPVAAAAEDSNLRGAPSPMVRLRVLSVPAGGDGAADSSYQTLLTRVAADVADEVCGWLGGAPPGAPRRSPAQLRERTSWRAANPGDIGVLVRNHRQGGAVAEALTAAGVPVVVRKTSSVFAPEATGAPGAAGQWRTLLAALANPGRIQLARAALVSDFIGCTLAQVAEADVPDERFEQLRSWSRVLEQDGVLPMFVTISRDTDLATRLLGRERGERRLTDLRQIAENLHAEDVHRAGVQAVQALLEQRVREAESDQDPERARRLETDADAVQVLTVHGSKGLEFPVVLVPFGWDPSAAVSRETCTFHDDSGARLVDVRGSQGWTWTDSTHRREAEDAGEELRLLYVALTRARCAAVAWWAPGHVTRRSPLQRLLAARQRGVDQALGQAWGGPPIEWLRAEPSVGVESVPEHPIGRRWSAESAGTLGEPLRAAALGRSVTVTQPVTSYSALTAAVHEVPRESIADLRSDEPEPRALGEVWEVGGDGLSVGAEAMASELSVRPTGPDDAAQRFEVDARETVSPMAELPGGAEFGTLVHEVLERVRTPALPALADEIEAQVGRSWRRRPLAGLDQAELTAALTAAMSTPLGPLVDDAALADIPSRDRLSELTFDLPLGQPGSAATLGAVAQLFRDRLTSDDPLADYPDRMAADGFEPSRLAGFLTGSIDVVLRVPGDGGGEGRDSGHDRYLVVDYKTNWLGQWPPQPRTPLSAWDYRPVALPAAMIEAHYPLQALLYQVALHRFLRWRVPGYDPDRDLGGVLYLYLRGMCGPDTPCWQGVPCGVFSWRPPAGLVAELSDLLATGGAE